MRLRCLAAAATMLCACSAAPPSSGPAMPGETTGHLTGTIAYSDGTGQPFDLAASAMILGTQVELIAGDGHGLEVHVGWQTTEISRPAFVWTPTQWEFVKFQYVDSRQPDDKVVADVARGWIQFDQVSSDHARGKFDAEIKQAVLKGDFDTRLPDSSSSSH
jgi:hypothetical protein